jgi:hypothetical protein
MVLAPFIIHTSTQRSYIMAQFVTLYLTPTQCAAAWLYGKFRYSSSARWMDLMAHFDRIAREAVDGKRNADTPASFLVDDRTLDRVHSIMIDVNEKDGLSGHEQQVVEAVIAACEKATEIMG